jgi:hypothetical protein
VAKILSQLHQRDGQSSIDPLHNATTKRFFDAQRRIDQRTAKRSDQVRQDNTNLDRLRNQSTKKEIKSVELNKALALDRLVATQETAPISAKKTLADYKDIAPRGIISDEAFQHYDPYKVKRNKIYTEKEFSQIRREDEELSKLVFDVHKKYSADPESITPEEYKWLFPDEKILCRDQRFSHYTPARIQKANIVFNDRFKLALYDLAIANEASGKLPNKSQIQSLSRNLEGISNLINPGPLQCTQIQSDRFRVDFDYVQHLLGEYGLTLGEGELAQFDGADFDIVKWSEAVGEAPIPRHADSPLAWNHFANGNVNDRAISEVPFEKRTNGIKL